jgi:hypothetical protein
LEYQIGRSSRVFFSFSPVHEKTATTALGKRLRLPYSQQRYYLSAAANAILLQRAINCSAPHEIVFVLLSEDNVTLRSHIIESENVQVKVRLKMSLFLQNQLN